MQFRIASTGLYAPPAIETAADLAPRIGRSAEWISSQTGVLVRHISHESVESMAAHAARAALAGGAPPDLLINASTTPRQLIPDTSVFILGELGLSGIPCYSVHATCISFLVALHAAAAFVSSGAYRRVLIVSSEIGSFARNFDEPESAALLGDGAGAAIIEPVPERKNTGGSRLLAWHHTTWPKGATLAEFRGGGTRLPPDGPDTRPEDHLFQMDGPKIYRFAIRHVVAAVAKVLETAGLTLSDIDLVVPHQPSGPGVEWLYRMGFAEERVVNIVGEFGNCIAASLPMALAVANTEGRLKRGDRVLLMGTGAGLSVALALLEW